MRLARAQTNDLGRADVFLESLVTKHDVREPPNEPSVDGSKLPHVNGGSLPFRDAKPRFSDPPAPPPQQPLPEKPDVPRPPAFEPSSPSLKRTNTERPRSVPNVSPVRQENPSQIISLVEALALSKKEVDAQGARLRDLEEMLRQERTARELAEDLAKRLEQQLAANDKSHDKPETFSVIKEAFEAPPESTEATKDEEPDSLPNGKAVDPSAISESTLLLEKRLEAMMAEMHVLKDQMASFKQRAESAETERDEDRKSLAEMVAKIRADESRPSSSKGLKTLTSNGSLTTEDLLIRNHADLNAALLPLLEKSGLTNGHAITAADDLHHNKSAISTLSRPLGKNNPMSYHAAPYASIIGVVIVGMSVMYYMNGWQPPKVDR
jgi:hypothetical protein